MPTELSNLLAKRRQDLGLSLREVEHATGISNAHISQIEKGVIERPAPNLLYELASVYHLEFKKLLRLAGLTKKSDAARGAMMNAAFRALDDLTPAQRAEAIEYLEKLRNEATHRK